MTTHQFALGEAVRLRNGYQASGNVYLVTALLPPIGDLLQYRIRNEAEKFERMATETNLERASAAGDGESVPLVKSLWR